MWKTVIPLFLLLLFNLQQAVAHDAWLMEKDGGLVAAWGHGEKLDPYNPQFVKEPKAFDCNGGTVPLQIDKEKDRVLLSWKSTPAVVTIVFDAGCWVKTTDGWKHISKRKAKGKYTVLESWKSDKYCKSLLKPCDSFARPYGLVMEIVPEKDPFSIKAGGTLPIKVLKDGKPFQGAVIKTGDVGHAASKDLPKTDKDGKASVAIEKAGPQLIIASFRTPLKDDPEADRLSLATTLTFRIK